ncbi:hypothetical protein [Streptomyces albidoflavus]|uniref:hypothetical protein n=1 Tax=Streptomyces albidoflavus TaxID=1886 RepID=UPI0033EBF20B
MPQTDLLAVRGAVSVTDRQAHRIVVFSALDDIAQRREHFQWVHPQVARQLGIPAEFTGLLREYLLYRRSRVISQDKAVRFHKATGGAQIYRIEDGMPLDLLRLGPSKERQGALAELYKMAVTRRVRVDAAALQETERLVGRACGLTWRDLTAAFDRQMAAQCQKEAKAA